MKFTIEIEDFYLDEEKELEPALKQSIIHEVVGEIKKSIQVKIEDHIKTEVKRQVEDGLYRKINFAIAEIVETEKVKSDEYNSKEMIPLKDFIKKIFVANTGWNSPTDTIKNLAKKFGDEMKIRYDIMFATQIVNKMKENNFLRDDVAEKLLTTEKVQ